MPKFFYRFSGAPAAGDVVNVTGQDAVHIGRALRAKPGDRLTLCDGEGCDCSCEIVSVGSGSVALRVVETGICASEPKIGVTLYLALTKGDKFEFAIQKCVELGAAGIIPVLTGRCVSRPDEAERAKKAARWQKISEAAAKQSGRGKVPPVCRIKSFQEAAEEFLRSPLPLFFYENSETPLHEALTELPASAAAFIGPEGGFTPSEAETLISGGGRAVSLGARILRAETAPIAVMAALSYAFGEF